MAARRPFRVPGLPGHDRCPPGGDNARVEGNNTSTDTDPAQHLICSAKGCRSPAEFALRWRNPKLHSPDRRKTWLTCSGHREHLTGFLAARGFLQSVEPLGRSGSA